MMFVQHVLSCAAPELQELTVSRRKNAGEAYEDGYFIFVTIASCSTRYGLSSTLICAQDKCIVEALHGLAPR